MIAFRIKITGRVQGVFFRASTKEKGNELNVSGWVRNEPDGTVLIEAEGEDARMMEFRQWCTIGSPVSKVEGVTVEEVSVQGFDSFEIVY